MKQPRMTSAQVAQLQYTLSLIHNERQWEVFLRHVRDLTDAQAMEDVAKLAYRVRREIALADSDILQAITDILEAGLTRKWLDRYLTGFLSTLEFDSSKPGH